MPRVPPEHLEARRRQILDAARRCFIRNGFHATSMQDILAEAELSAGATYRYFRSKEEIIAAIAEGVLGELIDTYEATIAEDRPLAEVPGRIAAEFQRLDAELGLAKIVLQVWAEAVRTPALAVRLRQVVAVVRQRTDVLVRKYQERGEIGPGDPDEIGKALLAFMPGFILQYAVLGDLDAESLTSGLRSLLREGKVTDQ